MVNSTRSITRTNQFKHFIMRSTKDSIGQIAFIQDTIFNENISQLAAGVEPFNAAGVIVAEDLEDVWIRDRDAVVIVETMYAQELSWLFYQIRDKLDEVICYYDKEEFYSRLADSANLYLRRAEDLTGLLLSVLLEASKMTCESLHTKAQLIKDEVLACVGSLSDVAEKI